MELACDEILPVRMSGLQAGVHLKQCFLLLALMAHTASKKALLRAFVLEVHDLVRIFHHKESSMLIFQNIESFFRVLGDDFDHGENSLVDYYQTSWISRF